jgi:hypothetical protein
LGIGHADKDIAGPAAALIADHLIGPKQTGSSTALRVRLSNGKSYRVGYGKGRSPRGACCLEGFRSD